MVIIRGTVFFIFLALFFIISIIKQNPKPIEQNIYHLIKLNSYAKPISSWAGPFKCVKDTKTSLIWEVKSYDETLLDTKCSYSWFDGNLGYKYGGSCFTKTTKSNTKDIVDYANKTKLCGFDNWRLPTTKELKTILFRDPLPGDPMVEIEFFPQTQKDLYWTSDIDKNTKQIRCVNFLNAQIQALSSDNVARVRLVNSGDK
jgi:hypothetical protein